MIKNSRARAAEEAGEPVLQSTISIQDHSPPVEARLVATTSPEITPILASAPLPLQPAAVRQDQTPTNPSKKIKLEIDRDMVKDLTRSLNAFSSFLKDNQGSSDESFEVLEDS